MERLGLLARLAEQEKRVHKEQQVQRETPATEALSALEEHQEQLAILERKVQPEPKERKVRRVHKVCQDHKVTRERLDLRGWPDHKARQVQLDHKAHQAVQYALQGSPHRRSRSTRRAVRRH